MTTHHTTEDLRSALAMRATSRGTAAQRLARMQRDMMDSGDAMALAARPNTNYRRGLARAMAAQQTPEGGSKPRCIACDCAMSTVKGEGPAASLALLSVLIPSVLFRTESAEDVAESNATAVVSGWVAGNVALMCAACNASRPVGACLMADTIDATRVLMSWEGIKPQGPEQSDSEAASKAMRAAGRAARGLWA